MKPLSPPVVHGVFSTSGKMRMVAVLLLLVSAALERRGAAEGVVELRFHPGVLFVLPLLLAGVTMMIDLCRPRGRKLTGVAAVLLKEDKSQLKTRFH